MVMKSEMDTMGLEEGEPNSKFMLDSSTMLSSISRTISVVGSSVDRVDGIHLISK